VLARTAPCPAEFDGRWIAAPADSEGYARRLYAALRELDAAHADAILIEEVPDTPAWRAVRDRLTRATH
jgi:L-threonylcarbamoyladenylate synthase